MTPLFRVVAVVTMPVQQAALSARPRADRPVRGLLRCIYDYNRVHATLSDWLSQVVLLRKSANQIIAMLFKINKSELYIHLNLAPF